MKRLRGVFTVMVTPFTSDEQLDEKGLRENIDWYVEEAIHGVICLGSTGEFASLSIDERKRAIDLSVDRLNGRTPVIAGTASNSTRETIELSAYAKDAGADAAIIVAPFYGLPTQDDLFAHYKTISENVSIPIMVYNNPLYSGVDMLPPLIEKLSGLCR